MTEVFTEEIPRPAMPHTGERLSQGHSLETQVEHFHRYYLARHLCRDQRVLDIASGEGYGAALLAQVALSVVGVDIDPAAIEHAAISYPRDNLTFRTGSAIAIPVEDACIDVLVSFETLEHFADHEKFLSEVRRILRPGGRLILSTPDRDIFSPPGSRPTKYHVNELSRLEFTALLSRNFSNCVFLAQRAIVGSAIMRDPASDQGADTPPLVFERRDTRRIEMNEGLPHARYLLCVASDASQDVVPDGLYIHTGNLAELDGHTTALAQAARKANFEAGMARASMAETAAKLTRTEIAANVVQAELQAGAMRERELQAVLWAQAAAHAHEIRPLHQAALERDAMLASRTWKLVAPAHRVINRFPKAARAARTGARVAFWTATLRFGQRWRTRQQARADVALLSSSKLFDRDWYLTQYPEVAAATLDPVLHYIWTGAQDGYDPHPLFDTSWYVTTYPGSVQDAQNPLAHYIRSGAAAGHDPHPLFDAAFYLADRPPPPGTALEDYLASSRPAAPNIMFDPAMYLAEYPDALASGLNPLVHYATVGVVMGHAPHPLFDPAWYSARYLDAAAHPSPLTHFLRVGMVSGLYPCALMQESGVAFSGSMAFDLPESAAPDVSIVIPAYGHLFETYRCLCALLWRTGSVIIEVILADDRPEMPIAPLLACFGGLRCLVNRVNLGFLRSCNEAARTARGQHLVFLNNDTEVGADWLAPLVAIADSSANVGMVGCKLLNLDGSIQEAGGMLRNDGWGEPYGRGEDASRGEYNYVRDVDCVTGACFLIPRALWAEIGGFDDSYAPAFYEEFDLAVALQQQGYRIVYQPASEVTHRGSSSYGIETRDRQSSVNHARFCRKWTRYLMTRSAPGSSCFGPRDSRRYAAVVLVIDDRVPEPDRHAGGLTLYQYLILLHDLGLKVVYCPEDLTAHAPYTASLQQRGIEIVHAPETLEGWLSCNGHEVDRVWIARPSIATAWLPMLRRDTGAPIYYYTHDLHHLRELRRSQLDGNQRAGIESQRLRREEFRIFASADVVMSPSLEEAETIRREVPTSTVRTIPPYLFATVQNPPGSAFASRTDIVFIGGFDHSPNVDAAIWLAAEIFPMIQARIPQARLVIVGNAPPPEVTALAAPGIAVTGYVSDLAPYYASARMSVSPLRYGAGVKGKIVGSLQARVPVVTTPIGSEGIGLSDGIDALIGTTAAEIADRAISLFENPDLCARLAKAGEAVIRERFSIERASNAMQDLFDLNFPLPLREGFIRRENGSQMQSALPNANRGLPLHPAT